MEVSEKNFRLNRKKNYKGEVAWEYTVRADNMEDLKKRDELMRQYAKETEARE